MNEAESEGVGEGGSGRETVRKSVSLCVVCAYPVESLCLLVLRTEYLYRS